MATETVADVVREMAAIPFHSEVYGETIQDFAARVEAANAREVEELRLRAEAAEADARRYSFLAHTCNRGDAYWATEIRFSSAAPPDAAIDAVIASGGEDRKA